MFINNVWLWLTLVVGALALPQRDLKIVNGDEVIPHSMPYQVHIQIQTDNGNTTCGASLLTDQYILTSAQCLTNAYFQTTLIILGAHNISYEESSQIRGSAASYSIHPNYDVGRLIYNAAIIRLVEPVKFNDYIQTVALAQPDNNTWEGVNAKVAGWGAVDPLKPVASSVLNYIENPILSNEECENYFQLLDSSGICLSGVEGKSFCFGDTGSPLVVDGVQIGIASYFGGFCTQGSPQVFTRISSIYYWILETLVQ